MSSLEHVMKSSEQPRSVSPARRAGRVEQRIGNARDSLPGERNDLPEGALGGVSVEPQADENRPPPNAPSIPP
jgi:hypothetical protein